MGKLENQIISILETKANGLMAKDLAKLLGTTKKELNPILYGMKDKCLYVDSDFVWHSMKIKAIRETVSKKDELPKNHQKKWTKAEKEKLMEEYISGIPMINIADTHKRTELAVALMAYQVMQEKNKR